MNGVELKPPNIIIGITLLIVFSALPANASLCPVKIPAAQNWISIPTSGFSPKGVQEGKGLRNPNFFVHHPPDPVNAHNGNLFLVFQDLFIPARGAPLEITRTYNSRAAYKGIFGHGWLSSMEVFLEQTEQNSIQIRDWDGSVQIYNRDPQREDRFLPVSPSVESVERKGDGKFVRSSGNCVKEFFSPEGRLLRREDSRGQGIQLAYAPGSASVVEVSDGSARQFRLSYTESGFVREITDPLGRTLKYDYDAQRNLIAVTGLLGEVTRFAYDADHNLTTISLPDVGKITTVYDQEKDMVVRQEGPGAKKTAYEYKLLSDSNPEQQTVVTDVKGNKTVYAYLFDPTGAGRVTITDATGAQTTEEYDPRGNLVGRTDSLGNRSSYTYDDQGRLLSLINPQGGKEQFTYMAGGDCTRPTSIEDALGRTVKIAYDSNCQVAEVINSMGRSTRLEYNAVGDLTEGTSADGARKRYQYDPYGNITRITDAGGKSVQYIRDVLGRITEKVDNAGGRYRYRHDAKGRVVETVHPAGYRTTLKYDAADNIIALSNGEGEFTFEYGDGGALEAAKDKEGNTVRLSYDEVGNLIGVAGADGVQSTRKPDALGRLGELSDSSRKIAFQRDAAGRLNRITNAAGHSADFLYDAKDEVVEERFGDGMLKKAYSYDAAGRLLAASVEPSGVRTEYRYDALDNLVSRSSGGVRTTYEYDAMNRLSQIRQDYKTVYNYGYGPSGELVSASGPEGTVHMAYTAEGLLESVAQSGMELRYTYDLHGRVASRTDAEGQKTLYSYDAADRLTKLIAPNGEQFAFSYDKMGRPSEIVYPNGLRASRGYDRAGNITLEKVIDRAGNSIYQRKSEYDLPGNPIRVEDLSGEVRRYSYDSMGRLIQVQTPRKTWLYGYDALGNRNRMALAGAETLYSYSGDLLIHMTTAEGQVKLSYDARGNLVREQSAWRNIEYRYDFLDRLVHAKGSNPQFELEIAYDALGRKAREVYDGVVKTTLHDGLDVVAEYVAGKPKRKYVSGVEMDQLLATIDEGGKTNYLIQDHQMSVVGATNREGKWLHRISYEPFGEVESQPGGGQDHLYYGGRPVVGKSGLVDNRQRFYRPDIGRFLSRDLISLGHAYAYGFNNPLVYTEPLGLKGFARIINPIAKVAEQVEARNRGDGARVKEIDRELQKIGGPGAGRRAARDVLVELPRTGAKLVKHLPAVKQLNEAAEAFEGIQKIKGAQEKIETVQGLPRSTKSWWTWLKEHVVEKGKEILGLGPAAEIRDTFKEIGEEQQGIYKQWRPKNAPKAPDVLPDEAYAESAQPKTCP